MDEHEFANRVVDIVDQTACHIAPRRILAVHRDLRFGRRRDAGHVDVVGCVYPKILQTSED